MPLDDIPPLSTKGAATPTFRGHVKETLSTLREVVLMPRDVSEAVPLGLAAKDDVVVLIHGFFASAGVFRPMRAVIEGTGSKIASFSHAPGMGIPRIARSLARLVERIPRACRVHLVGHSLGGLVARWYVQELGGHDRVAQTISLGAPFGGTERARPFRFLVGRQLCRTSPLLARLRSRAHEHQVPHTSIVAEADQVVVPRESAVFPRGEVVVLPGRGHNTLLFDRESIAAVAERIRFAQRTAR